MKFAGYASVGALPDIAHHAVFARDPGTAAQGGQRDGAGSVGSLIESRFSRFGYIVGCTLHRAEVFSRA